MLERQMRCFAIKLQESISSSVFLLQETFGKARTFISVVFQFIVGISMLYDKDLVLLVQQRKMGLIDNDK